MLGLKIHSEVLFDFEVSGRRDLFVEVVVLCTSASKQELGKIANATLLETIWRERRTVVSAEAHVCLVVQPLGRGV
jgi:hypothetical protein